MEFAQYFTIWNKLSPEQQEIIANAAEFRSVTQGTILHNGSMDCLGMIVVKSGQLRTYILSEDGREVTLTRLLERDVCIFSATCVIPDLQFDVTIEAEKDSEIWIIPSCMFKDLMEGSVVIANYANSLISSHFSEVMWLMEQIMWKSFDKRLAAFLLEETALEGSDVLKITHEKIANHMGTAREVVTRMLRYFQNEGLVKLNRGTVEIVDVKGLLELQDA